MQYIYDTWKIFKHHQKKLIELEGGMEQILSHVQSGPHRKTCGHLSVKAQAEHGTMHLTAIQTGFPFLLFWSVTDMSFMPLHNTTLHSATEKYFHTAHRHYGVNGGT